MISFLRKYSGKIIFLILYLSLFIGFYLNETASGSGTRADFYVTWQYVLNLKEDLFFYYTHWDAVHLPFHYIIISIINSFLEDKNQIRFFYNRHFI